MLLQLVSIATVVAAPVESSSGPASTAETECLVAPSPRAGPESVDYAGASPPPLEFTLMRAEWPMERLAKAMTAMILNVFRQILRCFLFLKK